MRPVSRTVRNPDSQQQPSFSCVAGSTKRNPQLKGWGFLFDCEEIHDFILLIYGSAIAMMPTCKSTNLVRAEMPKIYRTVSHADGWTGLPQYEIRENKIYRTVSHLRGWNGLPQYEIRGNKIYRTVSHADGWTGLPQYEIRENKIYRTISHVEGWNGLAQFEIR
jgi:hypothetical protein